MTQDEDEVSCWFSTRDKSNLQYGTNTNDQRFRMYDWLGHHNSHQAAAEFRPVETDLETLIIVPIYHQMDRVHFQNLYRMCRGLVEMMRIGRGRNLT